MATKAQSHKESLSDKIYLCVLVSWWRKCFAGKRKKLTTRSEVSSYNAWKKWPLPGSNCIDYLMAKL
jgi:hypothetical protein